MVDSALPVRPRQGHALSVRNRNHWHVPEVPVKRHQVWKIQAAMKSCNVCDLFATADWKVQVVHMEMQNVEIVFFAEDLVEHHHMVCELIYPFRIEPQSSRARRDETSGCQRIATREQRHVVTETDQFLCKPGDDTLRASVQCRANAFIKWRNLCNSHFCAILICAILGD